MSTRALRYELQRLRRAMPRSICGCETCRYWMGCPLVGIDHDGTEVWRSEPDVCPDCGRVVEIRHEYHIVGIPAEALAQMFMPRDRR